MARNEEKARGSLNRWTLATRDGGLSAHGGGAAGRASQNRPKLASECTNLGECEKWRRQIVDEFNRKLSKMSGLSPANDRDKIMAVNEECNRTYKLLQHWERQIRALGGPDYRAMSGNVASQGVSGHESKYLYFGVAKELQEVKDILTRRTETLAQVAVETIAKKKIDPRRLDHEYYGFNDDDLVAAETLAEDSARKRAAREFVPPKKRGVEDDDDGEAVHWDESWAPPDRAAVDAALLQLKKRQVLEKYAAGV